MSQGFVEVPAWFKTVRFVQIGLAVLVVVLNAIGLGLAGAYGGIGYGIFTSIATVIICSYYLFATGSKPELYNHLAIIILEVFMFLWWLSAFSVTAWTASAYSLLNSYEDTYADDLAGTGYDLNTHWKGAYIAFAISAAVSAIEWVLVSTTLITFIMGLVRSNKSSQPYAATYASPANMEGGMGHGQAPVYVQNGQYVAA